MTEKPTRRSQHMYGVFNIEFSSNKMANSNCSVFEKTRLTNTVASVNPTRDIDSSCYTEVKARKSEHVEWQANATENKGLFHYSLSQRSISS